MIYCQASTKDAMHTKILEDVSARYIRRCWPGQAAHSFLNNCDEGGRKVQ